MRRSSQCLQAFWRVWAEVATALFLFQELVEAGFQWPSRSWLCGCCTQLRVLTHCFGSIADALGFLNFLEIL